MKSAIKMSGLLALIVSIGFSMTACPDGNNNGGNNTPTPVASEYTFGNLNQTEGSVTAVTVTPENGKSPGTVTVYYEGVSPTNYPKSTTPPATAGTYAVTFDVAAASGWKAATGLSAGNLTVTPAGGNTPPVLDDYIIGDLSQTAGSVEVTITAKAGKSPGTITVYYEGVSPTIYEKSTTPPQTAGTYAVTFDVAAATGWNAVTGLSAGNLVVEIDIDDEDFGEGVIEDPFTVANTAQWNNAVSIILAGGNNKNYIINVAADFTVAATATTPATTTTFTGTNITVSLRGPGRTLTLSGNGNLIRIGANQEVILRDLTLQGHDSNNNSVVYVTGANSVFTMIDGEISGNNASFVGGGVSVDTNGTFTMNGGTISGNTSSGHGGGVYVIGGRTFTMNGGTISGNTSSDYGGGVWLNGGPFTMHSGTISGNISGNTVDGGDGGGVCVQSGIFTMRGGEISGNTANVGSDDNHGWGGGVYVTSSATAIFRMVAGTIYGSDATPASLRNSANAATTPGAALYKGTNGTATYGGTDGRETPLITSETTIRVGQ